MADYSFLRLSGEPFILEGLDGEILYESKPDKTKVVTDKFGIVRGPNGEILYETSRKPITLKGDVSVEVPSFVVRRMLSNYMGGGLSHHIPNAIQGISGWIELRKEERGSDVVLEGILSSANRINKEIAKHNWKIGEYGEYLPKDFYANSFSIEPYLKTRWREFMGSIDTKSMRRDIISFYSELLRLNSFFPDKYSRDSMDIAVDLLHEFDYLTNLKSFELDEVFMGSPIIKIPPRLQA